MSTHTVYLSRRNLRTLLSKLDRQAAGESTACAIEKWDTVHPRLPCSAETRVVAIEDEDYYDRSPGPIHPGDTHI